MSKKVILSLGEGSLQGGFSSVYAQLWTDENSTPMRFTGSLPAIPGIAKILEEWLSKYKYFYHLRGFQVRGSGIKITGKNPTNISIIDAKNEFDESCKRLKKIINAWLNNKKFLNIDQQLRTWLDKDDEIQVIVETSDDEIQRLPWHLWNFFEDYPKAVMGLCSTEYQRPQVSQVRLLRGKVKILVIAGNEEKININEDIEFLKQLPDTETSFLKKPLQENISDELWNEHWDILVFLGHSYTDKSDGNGWIHINQTDKLTPKQLSDGIKRAVENGLQLAIFNSCDGLGLGRNLADFHFPQAIVMREPVPNQVARQFLQHFMTAFTSGLSSYAALQEARKKLEGIQSEFPCATWLPVIYQNPAAGLSLYWDDLGRWLSPDFCPYQGLSAFQEEHAEYFFGQENFINTLLEEVRKHPFIAVVGQSGSGKSSVVRAGLIPHLPKKDWRVVSFRPGNRPFYDLAAALTTLEEPHNQNERLREIRELAHNLCHLENALRDVVEDIIRQNHGKHLLLFADQFEQLYSPSITLQERETFLKRLIEAINCCEYFKLVITLRGDFLVQALSYRPLANVLRHAVLFMSPMTLEEMQAVVEEPAKLLGVTIEDGLTQRILKTIIDKPGALPLLAFALTLLWSKQQDAKLTHRAYDEIGGVEAALYRYAEEVFNSLNYEQQERTQRIFTQLVFPGQGTEDARRIATRKEIGEHNWDLVAHFASSRLVVSNSDLETGEDTVEIAHEALVRWERLHQWLRIDRSFRTWQEGLRTNIRQWEASNNDNGALLQGALLKEAEYWLQTRPVEINTSERVFIQQSINLREQEQVKARRRTQILATLGFVTLASGGFAWQMQQQYQFTLNFQAALDNTIAPASVDYLRFHLPNFLKEIDKLAEAGKIDEALNNYRQIRLAANNIQAQIKKNSSAFPNMLLTEKTFQNLSTQSEKKLVSLVIKERIPLIEEDLKNGKFGKRPDSKKKKPTDFENQFSIGAARKTYQILMGNVGVQADINHNGILETPEEAAMLPCELLKAIDEIWRKYTQGRCGWYGSKNVPEDERMYYEPMCQKQLNGRTLTDEIFGAPYDFVINRLEYCQLIPKQVN